MKREICQINRQKWRVLQHLAFYLGRSEKGADCAIALCELNERRPDLKPSNGLKLDTVCPHGALAGFSKGRIRILQNTLLAEWETEAIRSACAVVGGYPRVRPADTAMVYAYDQNFKMLPRLGFGLCPTWGFRIAMLHAAYGEHEDRKIPERSRSMRHTCVSFGTRWGALFESICQQHDSFSAADVASMIVYNWAETGPEITEDI